MFFKSEKYILWNRGTHVEYCLNSARKCEERMSRATDQQLITCNVRVLMNRSSVCWLQPPPTLPLEYFSEGCQSFVSSW